MCALEDTAPTGLLLIGSVLGVWFLTVYVVPWAMKRRALSDNTGGTVVHCSSYDRSQGLLRCRNCNESLLKHLLTRPNSVISDGTCLFLRSLILIVFVPFALFTANVGFVESICAQVHEFMNLTLGHCRISYAGYQGCL